MISPRLRGTFSAILLTALAVLTGFQQPLLAGTAGPHIYLAGSTQYPVTHVTNGGDIRDLKAEGAQGVSLAAGDFNEDGYGDFVAGYRLPSGSGVLAIHLGNMNAFAPQDDETFRAIGREEFASPYLPNAFVLDLPVSPDFIAVGDFNGDSHLDLAIAAKGSGVLYILPGLGNGKFGDPQTVNLPGAVTALAAGEFGNNQQLIVGAGSSLLVLGGSPNGMVPLISYPVQQPVTQVAIGWNLSGQGKHDAAIVIGSGVAILAGGSLQLQPLALPVSVSQIAVGNFITDRSGGQQLALLGSDGTVSIAVRSSFDPRPLTNVEFQALRRARLHHQPNPIVPPIRPNESWSIAETIQSGAPTNSDATPIMFRTRISDQPADDIMILDPVAGGMVVILHKKVPQNATTFIPAAISVLPYYGTPVTALPLRVNIDGRPGVVALNQGQIAAQISMPMPDPTFFPNQFNDPVVPTTSGSPDTAAFCNNISSTDTSSPCSLREAVIKANATSGTDTIMVAAGTYTLTQPRAANPNYDALTGTLNINDSVNIIGAGQSSTVITWGTPSSGTIDMAMAVNEDIPSATVPSTTTATASISNLTIQNAVNNGSDFVNGDGDGGCMEFDTGTNGTATLTLTNVILQNCATTQGNGGGLVSFNSVMPTGAGQATISNSIIQGNSVEDDFGSQDAIGGGIWVADPSRITMTNSQVLNNSATVNSVSTGVGYGGGLYIYSADNSGETPQTQIHASTISGNKSASQGGGIYDSANLLIDQGTVISGNKNGQNGAGAQNGGGLYVDLESGLSATLTAVTITGNTSTGTGGGISISTTGSASFTMSYSRLAGNTAGTTGSNLENLGGTDTVTDNWWGTNSPSSTIHTTAGTTTFSPYIFLTNTASPNAIQSGQTSTITASLLQDTTNGSTINSTLSASNLTALAGAPVSFSASLGTLSNESTSIGNQVSITSASEAGCTVPPCTATITTTTPHGFATGNMVLISGVTPSTYDGYYQITGTTSTTFTYSIPAGTVPSGSGGTASVPTGTATATYTGVSGGTDTVNVTVDQATVGATITVVVAPSISKVFSVSHIPVFTFSPVTATLTFTITNANTATSLSGLAFTDNLPSGLAVANTPGVTNTCGGTVTATAGSGTITLSGGTVNQSANCTVSVSVKGVSDGVQNNTTGNVTATNAGGLTGNTASASITVINPPSITKSFAPTSIVFGATSTLTLTLSNSNANSTLNGVAFTDTFPSGMVVATPSNLNSTCTGTATGSGGATSVSLSGGTLSPGASCTVIVSVQGSIGTLNNSVNATATDVGGLTSSTSNASLTVTKANTATTVTSSANPSVFGQSVTFTATVSPVSPGAGTPTGTVTFLDGGGPIGTGTIIGGVATFTTSAFAVGNHTITTSYGGDGNFNGSTGSLTGNPQVVNKANTVTTVTSSVNPSVFGQSVTFTATVSPVAPGAGTPTGTVTFLDGGSPIGTGTIIGGVATFTTSALAVGNHTIITSYGGDGNFNGSTGSLIGNPQVVNKADTATTVTSSQNPQTAGQSVTFTATVSPVAPGAGTPTGTVTFLDGGSPIGSGTLIGGVATFTTSALSPGSHTITTSYGGDGNFNGSTGSLTGNPQVITQSSTTTTVTASQGTITLGDTVTFTATVTAASGTATGLVTFFDGNTPLGSGILNQASPDQATFSTALLSASGSPHSITAVYQGATTFAGSVSSPISEAVNERTSTTGVVLNPTTVVVGQASTATITLTDSGSVPPGTADTFQTTGAPAIGRTGFTSTLIADGGVIVAGGTDANNNVLNSAEAYTTSGGSFSAVPNNLNTARTGAVAVLLPNGQLLVAGGSSDGTANGALNTAELLNPATGNFVYAGSGSGNVMTAARFGATATLLNTGKVLISGGENSGGVLNSAELYDPVADSFTATGNLNTARTGASATLLGTGKVLIAGGSSDGTANGALNSAEVFDPAGNSGAGTFTSVAGANPTLASGRWQPEAALLLSGKVLIAGGQNSGGALTSADLYDPVADSFTASAQNMSQARANGLAVAMPNGMVLLAGGTTSQAVDLYDADSDRFDSTGSLQQSDAGLVSTLLNNGQVLVVGLTTGATPASDAELYTPSFNPLGTVGLSSSEATDSFGSACVLTPSTSTASSCTSTVTPVNVNTSPHTITGTYPADAVHAGSSNTASLTVNKADTTTTVTSSVNPSVYGQSVTFTATVSPVAPGTGSPTGTVTFLDGGSPIGTGTLSGGVATLTTSLLAAGNHTITTSYGGDGNFNGSTGSLTSNPQVVNEANTTTTVTSSLNPALIGQSVTFTATLSVVAPGVGTPTGTVTFLDGGSSIGTGTLSGGVATFSTSSLALGNHTITTSYGGDGNFNGSTGSLTGNPQVINKVSSTTAVTSSQNPAALGQSVTFTATVSPVAPGTGTPSGTVTFLDGGNSIGTGTLSGGVATFTTSSLAAGNHTITTSYGGDANFSGSTGSLTGNPQVVVAPPTISKVFNPTGIALNGVSTMTITITNPAANTVAEAGVAFTDSFPANLVVATPNGLTSTCGGTVTATAGSGSVSLTGGTIATSSSCSVTVNVTSALAGSYLNSTGPVSSTNGGTGNTASATLNVAAPPTISKTFGASTIPQNSSTTLSFTIINPNSTSSLTGIAFTDALPAGLVVSTPNGLTGSCGGGAITATAGSGSVSLSGATLASSASCTFSVKVTGTTAGVMNNTTGAISANQSGAGSTSNTATITVVAPPTFSKAFGTASIPLAGTTSLTFNLGNGNTTVGLTGVGFVDNLPAGLVVSTPNGLTNSCGGTVTANAGATSVTLTGGSIAASAGCTVVVNVTGVGGGSLVNLTGNVTSTNGGNGTTATAPITVLAPDMTITKSHTGNFSQGDSGDTYTITATNSGTVPTVGTVTVVDTLPTGLTATAISGTGWSCTLNTLTCTRNDALAATSSYPDITVTVNVAGNCPASVTNIATVSGGGESNTANDTATDVTTVIQVGPPLAITLLSNGITVYDGQSGSIQFTVTTNVPNPPPITFSCSGLPFGAACGFSPNSVTQNSATVTMAISTLGNVPQFSSSNRKGKSSNPLYATLAFPFFGLGLVLVGKRTGKKAKFRILGIFAGLLLVICFAGCGSSTPYGTPAGTYPITVTATSGSAQTTATVNLQVLR